jgi:hypothetical protein
LDQALGSPLLGFFNLDFKHLLGANVVLIA